jgi:hypothetical protein
MTFAKLSPCYFIFVLDQSSSRAHHNILYNLLWKNKVSGKAVLLCLFFLQEWSTAGGYKEMSSFLADQ